jgi:hypothetical protein
VRVNGPDRGDQPCLVAVEDVDDILVERGILSLSTYWPAGSIVPCTATGWAIVMVVLLSNSLAFSEGANALLIRAYGQSSENRQSALHGRFLQSIHFLDHATL